MTDRVNKTRFIFAFVGPSCAGKSHLTELLVTTFPKHFGMAKNYTSRPRRPSEAEKSDYVHVREEEILKLRSSGLLMNYVSYGGAHYGLDMTDGLSVLDSGRSLVITMEPSGPTQLKKLFAGRDDIKVVTVVLDPPRELVVERWLNRVREGGDVKTITKRLIKTFDDEFRWPAEVQYDYKLREQEPENLYSLALTLIELRKGILEIRGEKVALC